MTVGELKAILADIPDDVPVIGWDCKNDRPTEDVTVNRRGIEMGNGVHFEDAVQIYG